MKSIMLSVCGLLACAASAFPLNPPFTPEAVTAYKAKADAGDAEAQYLYSSALANGRGVAEDKPQAFAYAKMAAEQGYERALRRVGLGYKEGWGIESNAVKAAECYSRFVSWAAKAAENGDANAQRNLGWCCEFGHGVESNMTEAVKWYRKAAEQGDVRAQLGLCGFYTRGEGIEINQAEAVKWFRRAAEQGDVTGQCILGGWYAVGNGVGKDMAESLKWYRQSAGQGDAGAQCCLGFIYAVGEGVKSDIQEAVNWFLKAAEQGDAFAQNSLGWCYAEGKGVPKDMAEAVKWFRKAAGQGDFNAQLNLGWCYAAGDGVEKDVAESNRWYDKASQKSPSRVRGCRNFRWVILSLELIFIHLIALLLVFAGYSPSIVLHHMRSKQNPFLRLSPGYPELVMCLAVAFALWVGASCVDNLGFGENVVKEEFGSVGSVRMIGDLLAIMHLFLQLAAFAFIYFGIRRFMKWRRMRVSLASPRLAYVQYKICVTAEMSECLIPVLWLAYILTLVGHPILVGASALALVALLVYTWPTRKKYAKIISGEMMKYIVIYREPAESKPKQVVLESCSEMSLRHECEDKGWQVLLIRTADEDMVLRQQKSKKAHFTESRGFVLLVVFLVVAVLPFGLEVIGEATGLFGFPASRWMKEAFAILTR